MRSDPMQFRFPTGVGRVALSLFGALAVSGCATLRTEGPYTFTIHSDAKGCPTKATIDKPNCRCWFSTREDCVTVHRGDVINFRPAPGSRATEQPFRISFDPTGKDGQVASREGTSLTVGNVPYKRYSFNIFAPDCPALDPDIIVKEK